MGEGQVAHDLMAYLNKLCRGSEESQDQDISQMKKACTKLGDSRKKKKNKEETQCEETQVEETQSNATQIETEDSQLEVELESQQHDEASQLFFEEAFLEESQLLLGDAAGAKQANAKQGDAGAKPAKANAKQGDVDAGAKPAKANAKQGDANAGAEPSKQGDAAGAKPSKQGDAERAGLGYLAYKQGDAAGAKPGGQGDAAGANANASVMGDVQSSTSGGELSVVPGTQQKQAIRGLEKDLLNMYPKMDPVRCCMYTLHTPFIYTCIHPDYMHCIPPYTQIVYAGQTCCMADGSFCDGTRSTFGSLQYIRCLVTR